MGTFLDWTRLSLNSRAKYAYSIMMALIGGCWIWGVIIQREYGNKPPGLDWDDSGFGRGWALYILWQMNWALTYNFGYWLIGFLAREAADTPRLTSYVRALESAGQCISSGISSTQTPVGYLSPRVFPITSTNDIIAHRMLGHQLCSVGLGDSSSIPRRSQGRRRLQWSQRQ